MNNAEKILIEINDWLSDPSYPDIDRGTIMSKLRDKVQAYCRTLCECAYHDGLVISECHYCKEKKNGK